MGPKGALRRSEQRPLGPGPALQSPNEDSSALEIYITALVKSDLSYPKSVEIDQGKEGSISV